MSRRIRLFAALSLALSLADAAAATPLLWDGRPSSPPPPRPPAAADGAADEHPCLKYAEAVASWLEGRRDVRAAERAVEILDEDPVLITRATCSDEAHFGRRCRDFQYDVEQERARARSRLTTAEEKLAAIEEAARIGGVPMVCLDDPTE